MPTEPRKTIAIIPARGGSKRIPRKNIRCFNGWPMLEWSVRAPQTSRQFDEIMVRTEDLEFAEIAEPCSAKVPFLAELKLRVTLQQLWSYVINVLAQYRKAGRCFDLACCLYPTAAFVRPKDLSDGRAALVAGTLMCLCLSLSLIAPSGNHCGKTGTVRSVQIFPKMLIFARKTLKKPIMMLDNGIGLRCLNLIETVT